jgi:hypothetical protein
MNIYKISQVKLDNYNTYDSAVVVARSVEDARRIHPSGSQAQAKDDLRLFKDGEGGFAQWPLPKYVKVEYIGKASPDLKENTVIVASFNAG